MKRLVTLAHLTQVLPGQQYDSTAYCPPQPRHHAVFTRSTGENLENPQEVIGHIHDILQHDLSQYKHPHPSFSMDEVTDLLLPGLSHLLNSAREYERKRFAPLLAIFTWDEEDEK